MFLWSQGQGFQGRGPISWHAHAGFQPLFSQDPKAGWTSVNSSRATGERQGRSEDFAQGLPRDIKKPAHSSGG